MPGRHVMGRLAALTAAASRGWGWPPRSVSGQSSDSDWRTPQPAACAPEVTTSSCHVPERARATPRSVASPPARSSTSSASGARHRGQGQVRHLGPVGQDRPEPLRLGRLRLHRVGRQGRPAVPGQQHQPLPSSSPVKDDYPYRGATSGVDRWNFYKGHFASSAAWRVNHNLRIAFHNHYKGVRWSNAENWTTRLAPWASSPPHPARR